jgi:DNA repair protein RecO (recombination protein O)
MPLYTVNAIVLRRTSFGETDRIVVLYSREHGKLSCIAKGVKKPLSRLAGATETFIYARYQLATGMNLDIITQAEIKESLPRIRGDLSRAAHTGYVIELVDKLLEDREVNPDLFDLLLSTLYLMERPNDPEKITHMFELQFMSSIGYEPILDKCVRCRSRIGEVELHFSPSFGGLVCADCGHLPEDALAISPEAVDTMRKLLAADAPEIEQLEISRRVMDQIARAMRWHIRYRAERELKSLDFLQSLRVEAVDEEP